MNLGGPGRSVQNGEVPSGSAAPGEVFCAAEDKHIPPSPRRPLLPISFFFLTLACTPDVGGPKDSESIDTHDTDSAEEDTSGGTGGDTASDTDVVAADALSDLSARLHDTIPSIVYVSWTQRVETDTVRVEYAFDGGDLLATKGGRPRNQPRSKGEVLFPTGFHHEDRWRT